MPEGWVKLHRQLLCSAIFDNEKLLKVWIWCLCKATYTEHEQIVGKQKVNLKPGEFVTGRNKAGIELNLTPSTAWSYLKLLEERKSINIKSNSKFSVVTVANWELYQSAKEISDSKPNNKKTANRQQIDTNKNDKECIKNDKEYIYTSDFENFWLAYPRRVEKKRAYSCWQARIKNKADPEEMINAAKNYADHCRKNNTEQKFIKHASTFLSDKEDYKDWIRGEEEFDKFAKRYTGEQDKPFRPYTG